MPKATVAVRVTAGSADEGDKVWLSQLVAGMLDEGAGNRDAAAIADAAAAMGGDINIGLKGNYLNTWSLGLTYTHYYGPQNTFLDASNNYTFEQSLKDRDFIAFTVSRTF